MTYEQYVSYINNEDLFIQIEKDGLPTDDWDKFIKKALSYDPLQEVKDRIDNKIITYVWKSCDYIEKLYDTKNY